MSIVRQGTLPVGSLDQAITLNVQSSGGSHFETVTTTTPYLHRASPQDVASSMKLKKVVGGTIAWNQIQDTPTSLSGSVEGVTASVSNGVVTITGKATASGNISVTPSANGGVSIPANHVILICATGKGNIRIGRAGFGAGGHQNYVFTRHTSAFYCRAYFYVVSGITYDCEKRVQIFDLTLMFGSTIADYIYSLEQAHEGDGVAWFKALFGEDYYPYNAGELLSVKTSARKTYNADNVEIGSYPLDSDLELRGIPKLDSNNELYYDGDTYASDGTVTRKYGIRAYTEGDATDGSTMITDGTNTVYKLTTSTTESADAYTESQRVGATEEFVDGRTVEMPVGNVSEYKRLIQGD